MPDPLLMAWLAFRGFIAEPSVSAAIAAMVMAALKISGSLPPRPPRKWLEVPMVGLASFGMVPISITLGADPSWSAGIGAGIGYVGMVKLETRLDKLLGVKGDKK